MGLTQKASDRYWFSRVVGGIRFVRFTYLTLKASDNAQIDKLKHFSEFLLKISICIFYLNLYVVLHPHNYIFRAKCTVIVRLLGFLTIMLAKFKKETLAVSITYSCVLWIAHAIDCTEVPSESEMNLTILNCRWHQAGFL